MKIQELCQSVKKHIGQFIAGVAIAGTLTLGPPAYVLSQDFVRSQELERQISRLEGTLTNAYSIDISVWTPPAEGYDRPPSVIRSSLRTHSRYMSLRALQGLEEAMHYYPKDLLQKHIRRIELIRAYETSTEEIMKQGATPVANMTWWGGMSISVGRDDWLQYHKAVLGRVFESESFHHELAHCLTADVPEKAWRKLHPTAVYNSATWRSLPAAPAGFFNPYCTASVEEDIASTVELLYDKNYGRIVSQDPILKKKALFLREWYRNISHGVIGDAYWSTVQNGQAPKL